MRRKLVAAAFGTAVALGGLAYAESWQRRNELGSMRVWFDPPGIKYVLAPDAEDDGRGWRPDAAPAPKRPGSPRVVCVGDSVTYGVGVGARETWCAGIRRGLGSGEALNFGMNGWDAEQVATLVDARLADWEPDVVVWGTYVNDVFPTYLLYGLTTGDPVYVGTDVPAQARLLPEWLALPLVRHSALFRRLQGAEYARSERERGPASARTGWYEAQVDRVAAWSAAHDVPVVFLAIAPHAMADLRTCPQQFPVPGLCEASGRQYRAIVDALEARKLPWVDGLAAFQASGQPHYHPPGRLDPDHPNAAGHAVLARAALPAVRTALRLPEPAAQDPSSPATSPDARSEPPADRPATPRRPGGGRRRQADAD